MNKNYFNWLIKSRKISILFFILIYIAFQLIPFSTFDSYSAKDTFVTSANIGCFLSMLMTVALPVFLFSYIHRKSSADMFLSMPVSRREQLITNLVFTWLMSYGSFFIGTTLVWVARTLNVIPVRMWLSLQVFTAFALIVLILVHSAVYNLANSIFDGIVMIGAYALLPAIAGLSVTSFLYSMIAGKNVPDDSFVNQLGTFLSPLAMSFINIGAILEPDYSDAAFNYYYLIPMIMFAIIAAALLKLNFINRKAERAGQISDNPLSYPFIINIYLVLILLDLAWTVVSDGPEDLLFFYLLLFFIYVISSFVYKRTLKISVRPIAFFVCACILTIGFARVGWITEGFGLSNLPYNLFSEPYLYYEYRADAKIENLGEDTAARDDANETAAKDYAQVNFTLEIPADRKDEYKNIIDLMEDYRHKSKSNFYTRDIGDESSVYFEVYNKTDKDTYRYDNYYSYSSTSPLSEKELLEISKYCSVNVDVYNYGKDSDGDYYIDDSNEMSLTEFIARRSSAK